VFKSDGNLDFNMGKTEFLAKGPTVRHVYERAQCFLQTDPDLQVIVNNFTPDMFTTTGIEVLGTPIGIDDYIKDFVAQNSIKIMKDLDKLDPLTDGFSDGTKDYEHTHTIHECKYNFVTPRAISVDATHSYRYNHRKS
jgi:hypothetical protein